MAGKVPPLFSIFIKPAILLIAGFLYWQPEVANASERMHLVDDLKVINVAEFRSQLAKLTNDNTLTAYEREYLELLQGYEYSLIGDISTASTHLETMLVHLKDPELRFRTKALLVNVLAVARNYRSAFGYMEEISRTIHSISSTRAKEHGLSVIAYTYNQLEEFELAKFYAQTLLESTVTEKAKCHARSHLLEALYGLSEWGEFNGQIESAIQHCLDNKEFIFANLIRLKKHGYLLLTQQYNEANAYYDTYQESVAHTHYPLLIASGLALMAKGQLEMKRFEQAKQLSKQTLSYLSPSDFSLPLIDAYYVLYETSKHNSDFNKALEYYIKYSTALKADSDNRLQRQQAYYMARAELEVKDQRIALLGKDNELLFLQQELHVKQARITSILLALLALCCVILMVMAWHGLRGRQRFKQMAEYDLLTGIANRYHFNNQSQLALRYSAQNNQPVALILFDLDHFKMINDQYGHAAGDWALQAVVSTCRHFMRNNDVFGRIGGEEFAVVLPGCVIDKAIMLAEICRDAIAGIDSAAVGESFQLSASFGVSSSEISGYQLKQLLSDADTAMYRAKNQGRNQVVQFEHVEGLENTGTS